MNKEIRSITYYTFDTSKYVLFTACIITIVFIAIRGIITETIVKAGR